MLLSIMVVDCLKTLGIIAVLRVVLQTKSDKMESKPIFKAGDFVIHDKFGVGRVYEVDTANKMYSVSFYDTGCHRVRFSTKMASREDDSYHCMTINNEDIIRIRYAQKHNTVQEQSEPFSVERFNELANSNVVEFEGRKYLLESYRGSFKEERSKIISKRFLTMHKYGEYIYSEFLFTDEVEFKRKYDGLEAILYKPQLFRGCEKDIEHFNNAVLKKYKNKPIIK